MDKEEILENLKKVTKERYIHDIVKKVLMMNEVEIFIKENKGVK
jgi:hypothetical protein